MLHLLLDQIALDPRSWMVCFCNTGKEFDATLDFVRDCEQNFGVKVVWLEYTRVPATPEIAHVYRAEKSRKNVLEQCERGEDTHWFKVVNYETARRNGSQSTPFDELLGWANVLPNQNNRLCSVQMKLRTMMRYLFSSGIYEWQDFIGIRADEAHRVKEIEANSPTYAVPQFPLVEQGVTNADVMAFWKQQAFDLQLKSYQGNCDLCYLKKWWKRVKIGREQPSLLSWWSDWERRFATKADGNGRFFRLGQSYESVARDASHAEFDFMQRLEDADNDIPCGCTSGAFTTEDTELCSL